MLCVGDKMSCVGSINEVQHLGKREGFRYPEDVCTKDTDIWD